MLMINMDLFDSIFKGTFLKYLSSIPFIKKKGRFGENMFMKCFCVYVTTVLEV